VLLLGKNVYIVLVDLKNASSSVLSALYIWRQTNFTCLRALARMSVCKYYFLYCRLLLYNETKQVVAKQCGGNDHKKKWNFYGDLSILFVNNWIKEDTFLCWKMYIPPDLFSALDVLETHGKFHILFWKPKLKIL
jgi:hypothetical protein